MLPRSSHAFNAVRGITEDTREKPKDSGDCLRKSGFILSIASLYIYLRKLIVTSDRFRGHRNKDKADGGTAPLLSRGLLCTSGGALLLFQAAFDRANMDLSQYCTCPPTKRGLSWSQCIDTTLVGPVSKSRSTAGGKYFRMPNEATTRFKPH